MPVPTTIASLSTDPALNAPPGAESIANNLDDYIRQCFSFIRQLSDLIAILQGAPGSPVQYVPLGGNVTMTGPLTLSGAPQTDNQAATRRFTLDGDTAVLGVANQAASASGAAQNSANVVGAAVSALQTTVAGVSASATAAGALAGSATATANAAAQTAASAFNVASTAAQAGQNIGGGTGNPYYDKSGQTLRYRTLVGAPSTLDLNLPAGPGHSYIEAIDSGAQIIVRLRLAPPLNTGDAGGAA